jgi:hypothetical protein
VAAIHAVPFGHVAFVRDLRFARRTFPGHTGNGIMDRLNSRAKCTRSTPKPMMVSPFRRPRGGVSIATDVLPSD